MTNDQLSRRRFTATAAALTAVGLAGCADDNGDDDNNSSDDSVDLDNPGSLTLHFETEDGEPVSNGVDVRIEHEEEGYASNHGADIENGELSDVNLLYEGEYAITAESVGGEFDTVEESATLEEDEDEEATIVLEGATPDSELEDEASEGESEEGEEDEETEDDENGDDETEDETDDDE